MPSPDTRPQIVLLGIQLVIRHYGRHTCLVPGVGDTNTFGLDFFFFFFFINYLSYMKSSSDSVYIDIVIQ